MQALIENPILREMKIIKTLATQENPLKDKDLALINNCSIATARNDITMIAEKYGEVFGVFVEAGEIQFTKKSLANISKSLMNLFSESARIQVIIAMFNTPYQNRQYYCQANSISEASFYRIISNINKVLKKHDFAIKYNKGGYYLDAKSEADLRRFIVSLLIETRGLEETFIRIPFEELMKIVIKDILENFPVEYDMYYTYYSYYVYVSLLRETQGFERIDTKVIGMEYPEFDKLKHYFPQIEQRHLFSIRENLLLQISPWSNEEEKSKLLLAFDYFITEFSKQNKGVCDDKTYKQLLFIAILTYGNFEIYPKDYTILFNRVDVFITQFKRVNMQAYTNFHRLLEETEAMLGKPLCHIGDQLLFWTQLICPEIYLSRVTAKVKILSDLGKEHQTFYKEIFNSLFSDLVILNDDDPQTPDFIITNYDIEDAAAEILFIRDYPLSDDLFKIYEKMKNKYN